MVYVAGRSVERLCERFGTTEENDGRLIPVKYELGTGMPKNLSVDYIIHAAGNAHPAAFQSDPVGTIMESVTGTEELLRLAHTCKAKRFMYVSSGEVYAQQKENTDNTTPYIPDTFSEDDIGYVNPLLARSCYPNSKRLSETLCAAYIAQYGIDAVIVRPCHTYGPGFTDKDSRAQAQFLRNALMGEDIVLKSAGQQIRSYNYIADCVSALLSVLTSGSKGEAYNLANPDTAVSIAELAKVIAREAGTKVTRQETMDAQTPVMRQVLNTEKLRALGWNAAFDLETGIRHTLAVRREWAA